MRITAEWIGLMTINFECTEKVITIVIPRKQHNLDFKKNQELKFL